MSNLNIPNVNLSDFSEPQMESEYNYIDLSQKIKRKASIQEKINFTNEHSNLKQLEKEIIDSNDNDSVHSFTASLTIPEKDKDKNDIISFGTLIFYSLPSFGKMSCLVLLNINSTLYYETLGASLLYMSF